MKILTYNLNGIRAAIRKGFLDWLEDHQPEIVCLQELKAWEDQVDLDDFKLLGYRIYWHSAEKKGYSGVAVLTKITPTNISYGMGKPIYDREGRVLMVEYEDFALVNSYMPSGSAGSHRQAFKMKWLHDFMTYVNALKKNFDYLILCGDFNICHQSIDIHNPVANKNSPGFTPEERQWITQLLESGFIDTFRHFDPNPGSYTWWSLRSNSRERNLGWRIDYILASSGLKSRLRSSTIMSQAFHSDHCPVILSLDP